MASPEYGIACVCVHVFSLLVRRYTRVRILDLNQNRHDDRVEEDRPIRMSIKKRATAPGSYHNEMVK